MKTTSKKTLKSVTDSKPIKKTKKSVDKTKEKELSKSVKKVVKKASKTESNTKVKKETKPAKEKFVSHLTSLKTGDKAPYFEGLNQDGKVFSLTDYKGKKLILYFYPKDNTPGCTTQSCNLQANINQLKKEGYEVVGVSADDVKSHKKFADKFSLSFNLLADTEKRALRDYDVFGKKMFMGRIFDGIIRTTFVISEAGKILHVINGVDVADHTNQIRKLK